ncbi:MAG: DUF2147 domain-containing protein [SAR324 cluster bacterium]|nr:DUF2147 domain-containing protein [SAR324 cluster bacterium]
MVNRIYTLLSVFFFLAAGATSVYAADPDAVLGLWLTNKEPDATQIEIVKCGEKYCGKIAKTKTVGALDKENPDESLRSRKLVGLDMIYDFVYDAEDNRWTDGFIYNPEDGKTYDCRMWLEEANILSVKGTVGPKWMGIGKTVTWFRKN